MAGFLDLWLDITVSLHTSQCQLAQPLLEARGVGNIVFISAVDGVLALPEVSIYSSPKGVDTSVCNRLVTNGGSAMEIVADEGPCPAAPAQQAFRVPSTLAAL
ncbi:hypothetical protein DCAR_0830555 [Daucus carota subsp. sativus]|uniref:Uncharacterized protein n=1 Tax=Daucus carota subsp. sativus TaxID=79200 RepID=A0A175YK24_DAUCS|nr:hypothetical protein DCAR_0830555 [Daucus carota subsp. sativus]